MPSPPDFLNTFAARRQCFAELLDLSERQSGLVDSDDYPKLMRLLGAKQQIIGRLEALGKSRPRLWDDWRKARDTLIPAARRACEETLAESEMLLGRLLERERISTESLALKREQTARELQAVAAGTRVNQAYGDSLAPVTHRHLDTDL
ncbi:MAG TPA: hypothetical protein VKU82_14075 [Planctomycetaceae bacterium]|nr:hypothetical protein [Planctomycetaceae bacterium]